jgi:hypothetical protein
VCTVLLCVACLAVPYFASSHERHGFWKNVTEHKMCVSIFSTTHICKISNFEKNFRDIITTVHRASCKVPVIHVISLTKLKIFLTNLQKIFKYQISWNSVHWESSCSMQTDGQGVTKLTVTFF